MKWMEKSKRSEATITAHMKHEDDYGMNGDSYLSHSVRISKKGRQSRDDDTNWQQTRETTKNEGSSMHDGSCIGINYAHRFPKCVRSLHTLFCCWTNLFNFWPVREFLVEIRTANMVLWGVVFSGNALLPIHGLDANCCTFHPVVIVALLCFLAPLLASTAFQWSCCHWDSQCFLPLDRFIRAR